MIKCLLLPGMDGTGRLFARFVPHLPTAWRAEIVAYPTEAVATLDELVEQVEARVPTEGRWFMIAESFSGPIALRLAARRPSGLVAVVLVATFLSSPIRGALRWVLVPAAELVAALPFPTFVVQRLLVEGDAELGLEIRDAVAEVAPRVLASRVRLLLGTDAISDYRATAVPMLVIGGQGDRLGSAALWRQFVDHRPDAEHRTLRAPHLVLQAQPEASAKLISEFVERVLASTED